MVWQEDCQTYRLQSLSSFLQKVKTNTPTNDSSGGFVSGLCLLAPLSFSPTWSKETLAVGRERKALLESRPPSPLPRPCPAGGFPELNGTAGELDRGTGCQLPRLGRDLRTKKKKKCKSSEKVWGGNTHSQHPPPNWVNNWGGQREGGVAENPGIPAIRRDGGQKVNTYKKRERGEKEREPTKDGRSGSGGGLREGPGDPLTPQCWPRPGTQWPSGPRYPAARRPPFSGPRGW